MNKVLDSCSVTSEFFEKICKTSPYADHSEIKADTRIVIFGTRPFKIFKG